MTETGNWFRCPCCGEEVCKSFSDGGYCEKCGFIGEYEDGSLEYEVEE